MSIFDLRITLSEEEFNFMVIALQEKIDNETTDANVFNHSDLKKEFLHKMNRFCASLKSHERFIKD